MRVGQMYKISQMYKTSLKSINSNHNCLNHPQMYTKWPLLYKKGIEKCINELTTIDYNFGLANLKCIKINHKCIKIYLSLFRLQYID